MLVIGKQFNVQNGVDKVKSTCPHFVQPGRFVCSRTRWKQVDAIHDFNM